MADSFQETKYCTNCKKDISAANFTMHEVHCKRHIVLCEHCKEPVPRSEMEDHFNDFHAKVSCSLCGQDIEKPSLEKHMKESCSKKPVQCPYCELELPQSDLVSHQDYCGTRTEACVKCGQFVMMKDQLQHDASNCEYPTPKPVTNGQSADQFRDLDFPGLRYEFPDSSFGNPFAMNELSRMMDEARRPNTLNSHVDIPGFGKRRNSPGMQGQSFTNNNTTRSWKSTTNRKSELNKQRQRVAEPEPPDNVDEEADLLLAMRLQQEDDQELDSIIRQIEKHSPVQPPVSPDTDSPANINTYPDDDELIPCEFCGEPFPVDILVQHQSGCDPLSTGQWNEDTSWRGERNNEVQGGTRGRNMVIPVINNLDSDWSSAREIPIRREWESPPLTPPPDELFEDAGEVVLPCEFCDEVFPYELLIQHQSVCDLNPSMTPRVQTPAASSHRKPQTRNGRALSEVAQETLQSTSRSRRHQGLPTYIGDHDDSDDEIIEHIQAVRDYTEATSSERGRHSAARNNTSSGGSHRSVAGKYGAPTSQFDDYLTKGTRARTRNNTGSRLADSESTRPGNPRRSSEDRIRSTLDQLLNDGNPEHDLLSSVGNSKKKSAKNEDNYVKRGQPSTGTRKKPPTVTGASARDVMRELNRTSNQIQAPKPKKRVNGSVDDFADPPFNIQPVGQGRSRRRGDHVFSPEVRGRNSQARSRQKPSSQRHFEYNDDDNI